jgi:hypothetical protein
MRSMHAGRSIFSRPTLFRKTCGYIVPAKKLAGRGYVTLCSNSGGANFEEYREGWHLPREAAGIEEETAAPHPEESAAEEEEVAMGAAGQRVQNSFDFFRRQLGKGGRR